LNICHTQTFIFHIKYWYQYFFSPGPNIELTFP
jgi:hypothetical protein